jgi:hypothetical protein
MPDDVAKGLHDVFFELFRARLGAHHGLALSIGKSEYSIPSTSI